MLIIAALRGVQSFCGDFRLHDGNGGVDFLFAAEHDEPVRPFEAIAKGKRLRGRCGRLSEADEIIAVGTDIHETCIVIAAEKDRVPRFERTVSRRDAAYQYGGQKQTDGRFRRGAQIDLIGHDRQNEVP